MADIVVANTKKVNFLDRIIQSVVIAVNLTKMNRAIEEHIDKFKEEESEENKENLEKVLRKIVYLKYQYEIIQRNMYELKLTYTDELINNINTMDKMERLKVQKELFEMEYERMTKSRFHSKEAIKYRLLNVSSVIEKIKQEIKDEGKIERYNAIIKCGEEIDLKILDNTYTDAMYDQLISHVNNYTGYINDNYDIAKLPTDERELIELVFEAVLNDKLSSDIDKYNHEFNLLINICKNAYMYTKAIDKVFIKMITVYDELFVSGIIKSEDYISFFKEIFDDKIKTMVNDVKRTLDTEDEYLKYCKILMNPEEMNEYIVNKAIDHTENKKVKEKLKELIATEEELEEKAEKEKAEKEKAKIGKTDKEEKAKPKRRTKKADAAEVVIEKETKPRRKRKAVTDEEEIAVVKTAKKGLGAFGKKKIEVENV
ncbi:MAG: hypothetical protein RR489_03380 [Clostridia bacterium]